jgi:hypothetical protein
MPMASEVASFRPDDPDALVQASFACACCLHQPTIAAVDHDADGGSVSCRCDPCDRRWTVMLSLEQGLRLQLAPPWGGMATHVTAPRPR